MNCIECNIEFTPIHNRGAEHKYCSNKCRNKAAVKRRENRLKSTFLSPVNNINNIENEKTRIGVSDDFAQIKENYPKQGVQEIASTGYGILSNRINTNNDTIGLLEKLYESRNETFFYSRAHWQRVLRTITIFSVGSRWGMCIARIFVCWVC